MKEKHFFRTSTGDSNLSNMLSIKYGTKYSRMDQVKLFKGYLPQILFGPFLNTLSHIIVQWQHAEL